MSWLNDNYPHLYLALFIFVMGSPFWALIVITAFHDHTGEECPCNKVW